MNEKLQIHKSQRLDREQPSIYFLRKTKLKLMWKACVSRLLCLKCQVPYVPFLLFFLPLARHHCPGFSLTSPASPVSFVGSSPFQYWFSIFGPVVLFLDFFGWLSNLWIRLSSKLLLNPYLQARFHTWNLAVHMSNGCGHLDVSNINMSKPRRRNTRP